MKRRKELKRGAPSRSCLEVGPGDYVKIGSRWEKVTSNTAFDGRGSRHSDPRPTPRDWTVQTEDGRSHSMYSINRYAKAEDLEGR